MPIRHTDQGWFWGSKGPFKTKHQAVTVGRAAYANGYKGEQDPTPQPIPQDKTPDDKTPA